MKISIFGMGYVGCVTSACLVKMGHEVIGVEKNVQKIQILNQGKSPIFEKNLDKLINSAHKRKKFLATNDSKIAVLNSNISMICVGTPSSYNGNLNLKYLKNVVHEICNTLNKLKRYHLIIIRSTTSPGDINRFVIDKIEKKTNKKCGKDFGVCHVPEFLREGSAVEDFLHPPSIVIGESDKKSGAKASKIFKKINAPLFRTSIKASELLKFTNNVWHGLKIVFANEVGSICNKFDIDSRDLMNIFISDKKLNISSQYLMPGSSFGGSCLPKDIESFVQLSNKLGNKIPVIESIIKSNNIHTEKILEKIYNLKIKKIGIFGLSFKSGTDDCRESPIVYIINKLLQKKYIIKLYDKHVSPNNLIGSNKEFVDAKIPNLNNLMTKKYNEVITGSELIIIANSDNYYKKFKNIFNKNNIILDLVGMFKNVKLKSKYIGVLW